MDYTGVGKDGFYCTSNDSVEEGRWFTQKGYIHILILAMFIDKSYGSREEWLALHPWFLQMPKKKVKKKR